MASTKQRNNMLEDLICIQVLLYCLHPRPLVDLFAPLSFQRCAEQQNAAVSEGQQRQPWIPHQRQAGGIILQLQHRVQHWRAASGLAVRPLSLPAPGRGAFQPEHQPVLRWLLLHVHSVPLRHSSPGAPWLTRWRLLQAEAPSTGCLWQPFPHMCRARGWAPGVPSCPGPHPGGHLYRPGRPEPRCGGRDQWAPAHESVHCQCQKGPQLQDLQHQRGALNSCPLVFTLAYYTLVYF